MVTLKATVALAVVISPQGILLIERRDGLPRVAFPGGKVEPGETVEQAAVRETDEETGHRVRAVCVLGRREYIPPPARASPTSPLSSLRGWPR